MSRIKSVSRIAAALAAFVTLGTRPASAGLIVVSGDENIADALTGNGTAINPGDQQFFLNILGSGTDVDVQGTDHTGVDTPVAEINSFYNSVAGVTSTIQSGSVTSASLAGVNLFVSAIPANPFAASEIAALSSFSLAGGSIFLLGDAGGFTPTPDANLNLLLSGLGSTLQIVPDDIDAGFHTVGSSHIAADPLTAGVTSFTYTFVSQVSGGTTLFTASGDQTFIARSAAVVGTGVPEPFTLSIFGAGLAGAAAMRRRKAKA
jgi:hypothetical protein